MTPIEFPQANMKLAENQPEYQTLPVYVQKKTIETPDGPREIPWSMTVCYELSDEEIAEIIANKKFFYRQMLFGHQIHPMFISTKDPFLEANKAHWPTE